MQCPNVQDNIFGGVEVSNSPTGGSEYSKGSLLKSFFLTISLQFFFYSFT